MKMRVSGAEVAVGVFVLLGVLTFLVLYIASGGYEGVGRKWVTLRCSFSSSSGIAAGAGVRMNGIEIGLVKRAELDAHGRVELSMFVDKKYMAFVRQSAAARRLVAEHRDPTAAEIAALRAEGNSMASIEAGMLSSGGGTLTLSQGTVGLPQLEAGEALVGAPPTSVLMAVSGLVETLGDIAGQKQELPGGSVAALLQDDGRLYGQASAAVARLDGTMQNLDTSITALREDTHTSIEELRGLLRETRLLAETANRRGVLGAIDGPEGTLQPQVSTILASGQLILTEFQALSVQVADVVRDLKALTAQLPKLATTGGKLVDGGQETMGSVNDVIGATKRHWLLKDLFEPVQDDWLWAYDLGPRTP